MKLCAVADLHGDLPDIPECDVLVIAGDIAPDYPFSVTQFDPDICRVRQGDWLSREYYAWESRVPAQRIIVTPGNHDWWCRLPEHCRSEVYIDAGVVINDVSFWLTPWVSHCGDWNYMLGRGQRKDRYAEIPANVDVLVSHAPAFGVLDKNYGGESVGCRELRAAIYEKHPRHVFFGHIHEGRRAGLDAKLGQSVLHHVSRWGNEPPRIFTV